MRVTCPNCLTDYDVPDEAIAGRPRAVRCAHCGHQWRHGAPPEDAPPEDALPDAPDPTEANPAPAPAPLIDAPPLLPPTAPSDLFAARQPGFTPPRAPVPPPRRNARPAIIALLILALVIVVLAAHRPIMRLWPASAGFYQALGLS